VRAFLVIVLLSFVLPLGQADDDATPLIFFRKPDRATDRLIRDDLISGNGIGAGTRDKRAAARCKLIVIDAWAVPYLAEALHGRRKQGDAMVRMNAAATLARILDPRALPQLRGACTKKEKDRWVRRFAVLSLGLYRRAEDIDVLADVLKDRDKKDRDPAAALALGKIPYSTATNALLSRLVKPPRDKHLTGALLIAATIRSPETPAGELRFLQHKERLVQRVAAACLLIRPATPQQTEALIKIVGERGYREVLELQFHALSLVPARTPEIREALLDCAVKTKFKTGARVAALIGLADEWNVTANFARLHGRYRSAKGRNDAVVAALLHAMVRTGNPKAIEICRKVIKTGSPALRFYASAALFHRIALAGDEPPPGADRIAGEIVQQRARSEKPELLSLIDLVSRWRSPPEGVTDRRKLARDGFKAIGDPKNLHLFDRNRQERAWALLNRMIPYVLELDELLMDFSTHDTSTAPTPEPGVGKSKSESGSEEELDLLDFLKEQPYFVPSDLGASSTRTAK